MAGNGPSSQQSGPPEQPQNLTGLAIEQAMNWLVLPLLVGALGVLFEYVVVQRIAANPGPPLIILSLVLLLTTLVGLGALVVLWMMNDRLVRESYALSAMTVNLLIILSAVVMLGSGYMPWRIPSGLAVITGRGATLEPAPDIFEQLVVVFVAVFLIWQVVQSYKTWRGGKSEEQAQREEHGIKSGLFGEAHRELQRIMRREPPLTFARDPEVIWPKLETDELIASLAWKDQARELVLLTSTAFVFQSHGGAGAEGQRGDWHDSMQCWIGLNQDNQQIVALIPVQGQPDQARLREQLDYIKAVAATRGKQIFQVIVALKEGVGQQATRFGGGKIVVETEHSLLERSINLADYRSRIRERIYVTVNQASGQTIDQFYTPVLARVGNAKQSVNVEDYVQEWLDEPSQHHLAILGGYGLGKSTFSLMLTNKLLGAGDQLPERIPILIELRGRLLHNLEPEALLGQWAAQYGLNGRALLRLHEAGRLLLIFEGFDEMAFLSDRDMRLSYFRALWEFARYPQARIIVTGRQTLFEDEVERAIALRFRRVLGERAYSERIEILPFTVKQIFEALRGFPPHVRDAIVYLASRNRNFRELAGRPSLLHLIAAIWDEAGLAQKAERLSSAMIMEAFVEYIYRRQAEKEQRPGEFLFLSAQERSYFMSGIAVHMALEEMSAITSRDLAQVTLQLINDMPTAISTQVVGIATGLTPLRLRITDPKTKEPDPRKLEQVRTEVRNSTLLEEEAASFDGFKFGHKSFLEFLVAKVAFASLFDKDDYVSRAVLRLPQMNYPRLLAAPETRTFFAELLLVDDYAHHSNKNSVLGLGLDDEMAQEALARRLLARLCARNKLKYPPQAVLTLVSLDDIFKGIFATLSLVASVLAWNVLGSVGILRADSFLIGLMWVVGCLFIGTLVNMPYAIPLSARQTVVQIWAAVCSAANIPDPILHRITGTNRLPWFSRQPFIKIVGQTPLF